MITITATDAAASEVGPDPGTFTVTRAGDTTFGLTVFFTIGGTATNNGDYQFIPTTVVIPAGEASITRVVRPDNDPLAEGPETVVFTVAPNAQYAVGTPGTAAVTIADNGGTTTSTSTSTTSTSTTTTTSSSTSSSAPPTSSSTTTSTLPPHECDGEPVGPTFQSLACRLTVLRETTQSVRATGGLPPKLVELVGKAQDHTAAAGDKCRRGELRTAKTRMKQLVRSLIQYSHRLRTRAARRRYPEDVREPFARAADAIQDDARVLRAALACLDDAVP